MIINIPINFNENNFSSKLSLVARLALQIGLNRDEFIQISCKMDNIYFDYAISRYDFLKEEKERNKARNNSLKNKPLEPLEKLEKLPKQVNRIYDRLAFVPLQDVFSNIGKVIDVCGTKISIRSKRYKCYARKGVKCVRCGIEGKYFAAEKALTQNTDKYHLNLYANEDGKEILMTVDHIIPLSRQGLDNVSNLQTMCSPCNNMKGNRTEEELKIGISKEEAQAISEAAKIKGKLKIVPPVPNGDYYYPPNQ